MVDNLTEKIAAHAFCGISDITVPLHDIRQWWSQCTCGWESPGQDDPVTLKEAVRLHAPHVAEAITQSNTECHEAVVRKGIEQPCDKPAVAQRWDEREEFPGWYPVCPYHTRGRCRPLYRPDGGGE